MMGFYCKTNGNIHNRHWGIDFRRANLNVSTNTELLDGIQLGLVRKVLTQNLYLTKGHFQ